MNDISGIVGFGKTIWNGAKQLFNISKPYLTSGIEGMMKYDLSELQANANQERAKELIRMNQEYNSIERQVERMEGAGLNPAAILSNGNPSTSVVTGEPGKGNISPGKLTEHMLVDSEIKQIQAQTANIEADTALKEAQTDNVGHQSDNLIADTDYKVSLRDLTESKTLSESVSRDLMQANADMIRVDTSLKDVALKYQDALLQGQVDKVQSEIDNLDQLTKNAERQFESLLVQIEQQKFDLNHMSRAELANLYVSTGYQAQQIAVAKAEVMLMRSGIELNDANRDRIRKLVFQEYKNLAAQSDYYESAVDRNASAIEADKQWIDEGTSRKFANYTLGLSSLVSRVTDIVGGAFNKPTVVRGFGK